MDFVLSEAQKELQERAAELVRRECLPLEAEFPDAFDPLDLPVDRINRIKEEVIKAGLNSLSTPRKYGGQGLGIVEKCLVREQFSKAELVFMHPNLFSVGMEPPENVWTEGTGYPAAEVLHSRRQGRQDVQLLLFRARSGVGLDGNARNGGEKRRHIRH